jgi:hypothetical protein
VVLEGGQFLMSEVPLFIMYVVAMLVSIRNRRSFLLVCGCMGSRAPKGNSDGAGNSDVR